MSPRYLTYSLRSRLCTVLCSVRIKPTWRLVDVHLKKNTHVSKTHFTTTWLAQLGERRSTEREVTGSNPGRTNTQGLQITEKKVLPL